MSLKYCFQNEIHKKFNFPPDFPALIKDITSLFVQKLPAHFLLQYQDADGDMVTISNNEEYQTLLNHELLLPSSLKLFVVSLGAARLSNKKGTSTPRSNSEGSFEVVEDDDSLKVEEISDLNATDEEPENNLESKVVVSLKIPQNSTPRALNNSLKGSKSDESEKSFTCSEPENSRVNESGDLVRELSLSLDEGKSSQKEEDSASQTASNQDSQSREISLCYFERPLPQNTTEIKGMQLDLEGLKKVDKLELQDFKELDPEELNRYFSRIFNKNFGDDNPGEGPIKCSYARSAVEENKYEEESQEKWVSFSSDQEVPSTTQNFELQGKSTFSSKQVPENWFACNRGIPSRYGERSDEDERSECDELSMQRARKKIRRSFGSFGVKNEGMRQALTVLKDEEVEERKGRNKEQKQADPFEQDIWYDALYNVNMKDDFLQYLQQHDIHANGIGQKDALDDLCSNVNEANKENVDRNVEESLRENVENMNLSLLTMSEAKYMASAIGSMHKVRAVDKLKICKDPFAESQFDSMRQTSPILNKWANRRDDIQHQEEEEEEEDSPSGFWKKDKTWQMEEKRAHEGSFCMKCWESPIRGPRFVCLVCDDVEYCSKCASDINHIHPLLTIDEVKEQELDLMNNFASHGFPKNDMLCTSKPDFSAGEDFDYKCIDYLNKSFDRSLSLKPYYSAEETSDDYKFEYKELSTTPSLVRQNKKEWCVVYKTICLKNVGKCMWMRCHLEPIGAVPGTMTEISYLAPGDSALMALEMHGFFSPGKYTSKWRVVHQGDMGILNEMGSIDLEFEVLESSNVAFSRQTNYEQELQSFVYREEKDFGELNCEEL